MQKQYLAKKFQHLFLIKSLIKLEIERNSLKLNKNSTIKLMVKDSMFFLLSPLKSTRQGLSTLHHSYSSYPPNAEDSS